MQKKSSIIVILIILICIASVLLKRTYFRYDKEDHLQESSKSISRNKLNVPSANLKNNTNKNITSQKFIIKNPSDRLNVLVKSIMLNSASANKNLIKSTLNTVNELFKKHDYKIITSVLKSDVLIKANNPELLSYSVYANIKNDNSPNALNIIEAILSSPNSSNFLKKKASSFYKKLMINKINILIKNRDYLTALALYNTLSSHRKNDPDVYIVGIRILIYMGDWDGAEYLLNRINYPPKYKQELNSLKQQLYNLKPQKKYQNIAGKNIINFTEINNSIYIKASINDYFEQDFILDTGASITTIPPSSLELMGIHITPGSPVRRINTIGGVVYANEVTLKSISLNGSTIKNLKAVAVDLPSASGKGLLGMNFLKHFYIEINHSNNTIILTPKNNDRQ